MPGLASSKVKGKCDYDIDDIDYPDISGFSRFSANESLSRTGLDLFISANFRFYLPAFEISRSCRTASGGPLVAQLYGKTLFTAGG